MKNKKHSLGIFCLAITLVITLVGLWPFNFRPVNKVRWLKDQNGIHFYGQGVIFSDRSTRSSPNPVSLNTSITIEILIQPDSETIPYLPYILSIYDCKTFEGFFGAQWQSTLILQTQALGPNRKWIYKKIGLENALQKGRKRFISITSDDKETSIFVDGKLARAYPGFSLLSSKDKTMSCNLLLLGNSPSGKQFWIGSLFGLAIYDRALTHEQVVQHFQNWSKEEVSSFMNEKDLVAFYPFSERSGDRVYDHTGRYHLFIPSRFEILQKTIFAPPWKDFRLNRSYITDILANILGFVSFGFLFSAYLWTRKPRTIYRLLIISLLFSACISLTIELTQVYLPTRSSQLMDVITNTAGAGLGAFLFYFYHHKKQCNPLNPL